MAKARRAYGSGSLFKEKRANGREVWCGQFMIGGKQVQRVLGEGTMTNAQAETALRKARTESEAEEAHKEVRNLRGTATVEQVAERLFDNLLKVMKRRERTVEDYRSMLNTHLVPFFSATPIHEITRRDVERLNAHVLDLGRARGTADNVVNLLHSILDEALREGIIDTNPATKIRRPPQDGHKTIRFRTPAEIESVIAACADDDFGTMARVLYLTAAWTGLRQGELLALQWRNLDFEKGEIHVRRSWSDGRLSMPKTKRGKRVVPMLDVVMEALATLSLREFYVDREDLVFGHPHKGTYLSHAMVYPRFIEACKAAKVRRVRFHDLRHSFASMMASGGASMFEVQRWMGHASIKTTEIYADFFDTGSRDLAQRAYEVVTQR